MNTLHFEKKECVCPTISFAILINYLKKCIENSYMWSLKMEKEIKAMREFDAKKRSCISFCGIIVETIVS